MGKNLKSAVYQTCVVLMVFGALFLAIPPIPSVDEGHGYDTFPNPTLFIGLVLIGGAALLSVKYLQFPKVFWCLFGVAYILFSLAIHSRVWW
jgi:hypothetical protein